MPTQITYSPSLADLIDASAMPGNFNGFEELAQGLIDQILGQISYRDLIVETSPDGDTQFYGLTVLTKPIQVPPDNWNSSNSSYQSGSSAVALAEDGLKLVAFDGNSSQYSEFDFAIDYRWPIQRYISGFDQSGFSYAPEAFIEVLLQIADIESPEEFVEAIVSIFLSDPNAYVIFLDTLFADLTQLKDDQTDQIVKLALGVILTSIQSIKAQASAYLSQPDHNLIQLAQGYSSNPNNDPNITDIQAEVVFIEAAIETVQDLIEGIDFDPYQQVIQTLLKDITDLDQKFDQLLALFQTWLGNISKNDIEYLLLPNFKLALNDIACAIRFPRNWLIPLDNNGEPAISGQSELRFTVGSLEYSTDDGFAFLDENSFGLTHSQIGKTGITLELVDLKLDLSRTTNIAEADVDGRPVEFMGVYATKAAIGLPKKWFAEDNSGGSTLEIVGRNILIGTGGITGSIALEATDPNNPADVEDEVFFIFGKYEGVSTRKGFKIGFKRFNLEWRQNTLIESELIGSLTLPKVRQYDLATDTSSSGMFRIDIEMGLQNNGDFQITAKNSGGLCFEVADAFYVKIKSLEIGRDSDRVYAEIAGELGFGTSHKLSSFFKKPFEIKSLKVYTDGNIEFKGGSIPLPVAEPISLGPVELEVSNITFGSDQREHDGALRKYKYFGFSAQVGVGSAGVSARGDGVKFYFTDDNDPSNGLNKHSFLKIEGIGIDIMIPGNASAENAAVIIKGYLSMREEEYLGTISVTLPKLNMAGGASMRMQPKKPAWVVDAFLEMSVPIPLGPTGLGIYGFRGMFGYRYIATKNAADLDQDASWTDYYLVEKPENERGVNIHKMESPENTEGTKNPISIGAGLSLATSSDEGRAFSVQAFFLLSLPEVILIQGKANVMGKRVGLTDGDPPFFAMAAFSPKQSIEFAFGADYKERSKDLPEPKKGQLISLYAEVRSAYFYQDKNAWFVHFGNKNKPIKARLAKLFDAYAYLMLSARGIETGAGIRFEFEKKYGPAYVNARAYIDVYGSLSFEGAQVGAGLAVGGQIDVSVWGVGFGISLATLLEGTFPRPFYIHGKAEVCVYVKVLIKKFEKCIDVEFVWHKDDTKESNPVFILEPDGQKVTQGLIQSPVSALHIGSKRAYEINYFGALAPTKNKITKSVPLDSFIDVQFAKPVDANSVSEKLIGVTNAPHGNIEKVPPKPAYKSTKHSYKVHEVEIQAWSVSGWVDYHPYEALSPATYNSVHPSQLKIGAFQKDGKEYNKIRLLAQSPLAFLENSTGEFIPEQMGVTSSTLFCRDIEKKHQCITWHNRKQVYLTGAVIKHNEVLIQVTDGEASVRSFSNPFAIPHSLFIEQAAVAEFMLPEASVSCEIKLFTFAKSVIIDCYKIDRDSSPYVFKLVGSVEKQPIDLASPVICKFSEQNGESTLFEKIVIRSATFNPNDIVELEAQIDAVDEDIYRLLSLNKNDRKVKPLYALRERLKAQLAKIKSSVCTSIANGDKPYVKPIDVRQEILIAQQEELQNSIQELEKFLDENCKDTSFCDPTRNIKLPETCLKSLEQFVDRYKKTNPRLATEISELIRSSQKLSNNLLTSLDKLSEKTNAVSATLLTKCEKVRQELEGIKSELENNNNELQGLGGFSGYESGEEKNSCGTYIHQICWLSESVSEFNQSIPSQEAIDADYSLAEEAATKVSGVVWRPNTTFRIKLRVSDQVDNGTTHYKNIYYGFKTEGPIGFFDVGAGLGAGEQSSATTPSSDYDQTPEQEETSLQFYINVEKSYPYGSILNAKPLYYKDPDLKLFFNRPYVQHFFTNWPQYNGLPATSGSLEVLIKDPAEGSEPSIVEAHQASAIGQLPATTPTFTTDNDPVISQATQLYSQLRNPEIMNSDYTGAGCWQSGGDPIKPLSKNLDINVEYLKPEKLYSAIVYNHFENKKTEVLRYNFQTSRYENLIALVNSYHLTEGDSASKDAIFYEAIDPDHTGLSDAVFLSRTHEIVRNLSNFMSPYTQVLTKTYPDPFQKLFQGHFAIDAYHPQQGLEFNFLRLKGKSKNFAIWIRSIEPINDPRIPDAELIGSLNIIEDNIPASDYSQLWSGDRTEIILLNSRNEMPSDNLKIEFSHLEWNGEYYLKSQTAITDNLVGAL